MKPQLVTGNPATDRSSAVLYPGPAIRLACLRQGRHTPASTGRSRLQVAHVPAACVLAKLRQALQSRSVSIPQARQ